MGSSEITVMVRRGEAIRPHLPAMAALRIGVFREWPYLYEGTVEAECEYLASYADSPTAIVILALCGDVVVGVSTALGMEEAPASVRASVAAGGLRPESVLYAAESVLLSPWRHGGVGRRFFELREAHARELGRSHIVFCRVERHTDDPRRPSDAVDLDDYWRRRGYVPAGFHPVEFSWREIGADGETAKRMSFWVKSLTREG